MKRKLEFNNEKGCNFHTIEVHSLDELKNILNKIEKGEKI